MKGTSKIYFLFVIPCNRRRAILRFRAIATEAGLSQVLFGRNDAETVYGVALSVWQLVRGNYVAIWSRFGVACQITIPLPMAGVRRRRGIVSVRLQVKRSHQSV